jgi:peroxiredoxin
MSKLITPGDLAPDFQLQDVTGRTVRLSEFRGRPVVLSFLRGFM